MREISDREIDAALARGRTDAMEEPRVASVRYEPSSRRVILELANACTFAFPADLAQGLETASDEELAGIEILDRGYGLHWPALDVDLSVPHLLAGLFGTASFMARRAGRATSPAKADAARANGAKGGRPKRAAGV